MKALAATYQIEDGPNDKGEMYKRPGRPADYFPSPFPNDEAGAAAYGKAPPDMSDLAKARGWERGFPWFLFDFFTQSEEAEGPDYIHAVLNGYTKPDDIKYNIYLPNHKIAMPKPLSDGQVQYEDGAPETVDQYGKDVGAFLMWAAEPKLDERKAMGFRVMIFLILFAEPAVFREEADLGAGRRGCGGRRALTFLPILHESNGRPGGRPFLLPPPQPPEKLAGSPLVTRELS